MMRLALQVPNFTYPDVEVGDLFETVAEVATAAEASGFDTLLVMDHFYQLPMLGSPDQPMFEAYTLLSALAARTSSIQLGTLVTGVTYRNPAFLAKVVTNLDVISRGRAMLGIGAAWFDMEHDAFGYDFPPVSDRFEMLEEAIQITQAMFADERPTFEGKHFQVRDIINNPKPIRAKIPLMVGGAGEKKTLRIAARYADHSNLTCGLDEVPHKLDVLAGHLAEVGRERSEIGVSALNFLIAGDTDDEAFASRDELVRGLGMEWDTLDDGTREMLGHRMLVGGPDSIGEQVQERILGQGLDAVVVNIPTGGHLPEVVARSGEILTKALS
ncbi:MAG TPA: LLM class F420-dependent oxidoreductase [Acidimicrobiales bacterium]